jgi:hypothetical protein
MLIEGRTVVAPDLADRVEDEADKFISDVANKDDWDFN